MKEASSADSGQVQSVVRPLTDRNQPRGGASLWLWVAGGFLFLGLLWTGMFMASRRADTRSVPLTTQGGRP